LDFSEAISTADAAVSLVKGNLVYCGYNETMSDIMELCNEEQANCSPLTLWNNIEKNYFILIGLMSSIGDMVLNHQIKTKEELFKVAYECGTDVGRFLIMVFDV
jgi:hypothetical protein